MKLCKNCGAKFDDYLDKCPWCGKVYQDEEVNTNNTNISNNDKEDNIMSLLKYADLMNDQLLYKTATCKLNGVGVKQNVKEAFEMFKVLAFRGNYDGMYQLSLMLLEQNDRKSAYSWLKISADGGHKPSQIKLMMEFNEYTKEKTNNKLLNYEKTNENIVSAAMPSIVMIESLIKRGDATVMAKGSGFIIEGGYVITNEHVITTNPSTITAKFEEGINKNSFNLKPVKIAPEYDLAILEFTGEMKDKIMNNKSLSLRLECDYGEEVYTIGNPIGLGFSVSKGIISNPKRVTNYKEVKEVIQTDITANSGNSGGALLDKNNNVLGVITYHPGNIEGGITMCVPSSYIVKLLNEME